MWKKCFDVRFVLLNVPSFYSICYAFREVVLVFKLLITQKSVSPSWNSDMAQSTKGQSWIFVTDLWQEESGPRYQGTENHNSGTRLCKESVLEQTRMRISKSQSHAASLWHCSFPAHAKVLPVRSPKYLQFLFWKRHFQGLCVMWGRNIQYLISRVFDIPSGVTKDNMYWTFVSQEVWNISVWSYSASGFEVDRTSNSGRCFIKHFFGTSVWGEEAAFIRNKQKVHLKFFQLLDSSNTGNFNKRRWRSWRAFLVVSTHFWSWVLEVPAVKHLPDLALILLFSLDTFFFRFMTLQNTKTRPFCGVIQDKLGFYLTTTLWSRQSTCL